MYYFKIDVIYIIIMINSLVIYNFKNLQIFMLHYVLQFKKYKFEHLHFHTVVTIVARRN